MGEIADDMINGCCCSLCGQYFLERKNPKLPYTHGYPVACNDCWWPDCGYEKEGDEAITA